MMLTYCSCTTLPLHKTKNGDELKELMKCVLCGENRSLQNSHIISSAAHKLTKIRGKNVVMGGRKGEYRRINQKDYAEDMLCFDCEQEMSVIETNAISACNLAWSFRDRRHYKIPAASIQPLIAFAYLVFWRASKSKCVDSYKVEDELENRLRSAFKNGDFPDSQNLSVSVSFLKILDFEHVKNILLAPLTATIPGSSTAHYFIAFGFVFRMFAPGGTFEVQKGEFLDIKNKQGYIYQLSQWEKDLFDSMLTESAVLAIMDGATSSSGVDRRPAVQYSDSSSNR